MKKAKTFRVNNLGIENSQYFQGYGVACTPYTDCAVGIGDNPAKALDDCLEQIATMGIDAEDLAARILEVEGECPDAPSVPDEYPDSEDCQYYIGISWTVEG